MRALEQNRMKLQPTCTVPPNTIISDVVLFVMFTSTIMCSLEIIGATKSENSE